MTDISELAMAVAVEMELQAAIGTKTKDNAEWLENWLRSYTRELEARVSYYETALSDAKARAVGRNIDGTERRETVARDALPALLEWFGYEVGPVSQAGLASARELADSIAKIVAETLQAENARLKHDNEMLKTGGIIEVAVRNPSVAAYMDHWEHRAENAEADVARLTARIEVLKEALRPFAAADASPNNASRLARARQALED